MTSWACLLLEWVIGLALYLVLATPILCWLHGSYQERAGEMRQAWLDALPLADAPPGHVAERLPHDGRPVQRAIQTQPGGDDFEHVWFWGRAKVQAERKASRR